MKAADGAFYESLNGLGRGGLMGMVRSMHEKLSGLEAREAANQRIYTEMYIQYSDLKNMYDALRKCPDAAHVHIRFTACGHPLQEVRAGPSVLQAGI